MKKILCRFLLFFVPFSLLLYALLSYLDKQVFSEQDFYYSPLSIIGFLFVSTTLIYLAIVYIHKVFPDKSGFAFLALGMLKMFASVIFLVPLIQSETANKTPAVLFFFSTYFVVLFVETWFVIRLINKK